ncbi:MAG TPA: endo-1,4-beta-xylanase, partial [Pyrinomonadaceae bacterium]|nr:endo-1,4-beta-xylanase [Pyrinomonadaceae bacterium]
MRSHKRLLASSLVMCLLLMEPLALQAQLRTPAQQRGISVGAAVAMSPFRNETAYTNTLSREFNMLVAENAFKWDAVHPARNTFNFTDTDALVGFAAANNMRVRGHTLVWHQQIPGWLLNGNFTRDEVIAILHEHIMTLVGRYRGMVAAWDVVNEAFEENGTFRNSFWLQRIGQDYIRMAFQFAREADPAAKLYINDFNTEGVNAKSNALFNLVRDLRAQGVPIDGVGIQDHLINPFRVQQQHRDNLQRLAGLGVEISFTEVDIRIALPTSS